jgi:redox-sensitive bicupin YhaK (pirin superfamily)
MSAESFVLETASLGFQWPTIDPFLFCVHHDDAYPPGDARMGVSADKLRGRQLGSDFELRDGFRMYHGQVVPGFPSHPHRGFETLTLARRGYIDHSDSLGAKARFGHGDAQWMTAGGGVVHSEMFPLVREDAGNPTELFQVWINLPAEDKMVPAHFSMLWSEDIPEHRFVDDAGRTTIVTTVAGALNGITPPPPPPHSWASRPESGLAVWTLRLEPGAKWVIPAGPADAQRLLYAFEGSTLRLGGEELALPRVARVRPGSPIAIENGDREAEILMLQAKPIGEPVARRGPFVMNTNQEIQQAYADYRRTRFGGWPWPHDAPVHPRTARRFAVHADGRRDEPKLAKR